MTVDPKITKLIGKLSPAPQGFWARRRVRNAVKKLALCDRAEAVAPLVELLLGKDQDLAERAAAALKWMNAEEVKTQLAQLYHERRSARLLRVMREGNLIPENPPELRIALLLKLGEYRRVAEGGPEIIEPLLAALADPDEEVAGNAKKAWKAVSEEVRTALCASWLETRAPDRERLIVEYLIRPREPYELSVMVSLKLGYVEEYAGAGPEILGVCLKALTDRDPVIADSAHRILGALGNPATVEELCRRYLESRDGLLERLVVEHRYQPETDFAAKIVIRLKLGMIAYVAREGAEVIPVLLDALSDRDAAIREGAERALRSLKNQEAINRLCSLYFEARSPVAAAAIKEAQYQATEPYAVKIFTLIKLGKHGDLLNEGKEMLDLLIVALDDPDEEIRTNADFVVAAMSRRDLIEEVCTRVMLEDNERLLEAAVLNGLTPKDKTRQALFYFLSDQRPEYERIDPRREILARALKEEQPELRSRLLAKIRETSDPKYLTLLQ